MRPASLLVPMAIAASLWSVAPASAADATETAPPPPSPAIQRILNAADAFDAQANGIHARTAVLRNEALEARRDAEELLEQDCTCQSETGSASYGFDSSKPAWWDNVDDEPSANEEEAADLLDLADRFERRADTLDAAAERLAGHAKSLRDKAQKMMDEGSKAQKLIARAQFLRAQAQKLRDAADQLRDSAFEGDAVDEADVAKIVRMEKKAAAFDKTADRFEKLAAAACKA